MSTLDELDNEYKKVTGGSSLDQLDDAYNEHKKQPSLASDLAYTATSAANAGLAGTARTLDTIFGDGKDGEFIKRLDANVEYGNEQLSDAQKEANQKTLLSDKPGEFFGEGMTDGRKIGGLLASGAGSLVPMLATGGPLGAGLKAGAVKLGASVGGKVAAGASALGYGLSEAGMVGGGVSGDIQKVINDMPQEIINEAPAYQKLINSGLNDVEARGELGRELGVEGMIDSVPLSVLFGTVGGHFMSKALSGKLSGSRLKNAASGVLAEGPTEAGQGASEQYVKNIQLGQVNPEINAWDDVAESGLGEGIGGAGMGAGMGFVSSLHTQEELESRQKADSFKSELGLGHNVIPSETVNEQGVRMPLSSALNKATQADVAPTNDLNVQPGNDLINQWEQPQSKDTKYADIRRDTFTEPSYAVRPQDSLIGDDKASFDNYSAQLNKETTSTVPLDDTGRPERFEPTHVDKDGGEYQNIDGVNYVDSYGELTTIDRLGEIKEIDSKLINQKPKQRTEQLTSELQSVKEISTDPKLNKIIDTEIKLINAGKGRDDLATRLQNPNDRITKRLTPELYEQVNNALQQKREQILEYGANDTTATESNGSPTEYGDDTANGSENLAVPVGDKVETGDIRPDTEAATDGYGDVAEQVEFKPTHKDADDEYIDLGNGNYQTKDGTVYNDFEEGYEPQAIENNKPTKSESTPETDITNINEIKNGQQQQPSDITPVDTTITGQKQDDRQPIKQDNILNEQKNQKSEEAPVETQSAESQLNELPESGARAESEQVQVPANSDVVASQESNAETKAKDSILTPTNKVYASSSKSVRDNTQRAAIKDGVITLLNKSGRKTVSKNKIPLEKWAEIDKSPGNPSFNKRKYIESLNSTVTDNTPESDSLKNRIIDSQISAINDAYGRLAKDSQVAAKTGINTALNADSDKKAQKAGLNGVKGADSNIDIAAKDAAHSPDNNLPEPSDAQKEAGNYKLGHTKIQGLDVSIENPKNSMRSGKDDDGKEWSNKIKSHYGYFKGTVGKDKDHVDVFIGNDAETASSVFIVDQINPKTGAFDEHKVMMGYADKQSASDAYNENYDKGWKGLSNITEMPIDEFKLWVKDKRKTSKRADESKPSQEAITPTKDPATATDTASGDATPASVPATKSEATGGKEKVKYHPAIENMAKDLIEGGGIQVDKDGRRNKSLNPEWFVDGAFKIMSADGKRQLATRLSVKEVKQAVDDYVADKKTTGRQDRILSALSEAAEAEQEFANERYSDQQKSEANLINAGIINGGIDVDKLHEADSPEAFDELLANAAEVTNIDDFFGVDNEIETDGQGENASASDIKEASPEGLKSYTAAELEQQAAEQKQRDRQAAERELKAKQKEASDKSVDSLAGEMLDGDKNKDLFDDVSLVKGMGKADTAKPVDSAEIKQAKADLDKALGDLGEIFLAANIFTKKAVPTELNTADLVPVLAKVMDASFRLGYLNFKQNANFVLDTIREKFGDNAADSIKINQLQGAYIAMGKGTDSFNEVGKTDNIEKVTSSQKENENPASIKVTKGELNVSDTTNTLEQDEAGDKAIQAAIQNTGEQDRPGTKRGRGKAIKTGVDTGKPDNIPETTPAIGGSEGDQGVSGENAITGTGATGDIERGGGIDSGSYGKPNDDRQTTSKSNEVYEQRLSIAEKIALQKKAESIKSKPGIESIRETLPVLLAEQQDDVLKAENRFIEESGFMLTNGTGTGKTYSALGVIKRFSKKGKNNILIVAPNSEVINDWISSGKNLSLEISKLKNKTDKGAGVTVTSYENFRDNTELLKRNYDLLVFDESHKLNSNQSGQSTAAQVALRMASNLYGYDSTKANAIHSVEYLAHIAKINAEVERLDNLDKKTGRVLGYDNRDKAREKYSVHGKKLDTKINNERTRILKQTRSKVLFLSASPFAYHKSMQYADGFLFDSGAHQPRNGDEATGYNVASGFDKFLQETFAYQMKTGKLNQPGADVDTSLAEKNANDELKKSGALSGRGLVVDPDYSREFILIDDSIGKTIDDGIEFLHNNNEKYPGFSEQLYKRFDYLNRLRLLEALKAHHAIDRIKKHHSMGRKVVVFHDYKTGQSTHPFHFSPTESVKASDIKKFNAERQDLINLNLNSLGNVVSTLTSEFKGALVYNGDTSRTNKILFPKQFNDDNGANLIIVLRAAGKEGISLHDTTGKHQRVLIDMGLPVRPTDSIQTEGRIYRTGVKTNAPIEYFTTGLNYEASAFAQAIAVRSGTAENLAMGHDARDLMSAFVNGYTEPNNQDPSDKQGVGGKEGDRYTNEATELDQAKLEYAKQQKNTKSRQNREGKDYYATPEPVGLAMVQWANLKPNQSALEPSAGHGAIARYFPAGTKNTFIEPSYTLAPQLGMLANGDVKNQDFEDLNTINKYDSVIMNPPFGMGGSTAIKHIEKAFKHLKGGGRLIAIIPKGSMDSKLDKFMESEGDAYAIANIELPSITFKKAGTGVLTQIVIIDKIPAKWIDNGAEAPNHRWLDYRTVEKQGELFDSLNSIEIDERVVKLIANDEAKFSKAKQQTTKEFSAEVKAELGLKDFHVFDNNGDIELSSIIVNKEGQRSGKGTQAMDRLIAYADKQGKRVVLSPVLPNDSHGTTSRARLVKFYKRFGFIESKGRNIDYVLGAGKMYRNPAIKKSVGQSKSTSTVSQIKSLLPRRVKRLLESGKLKVVQSVSDLPKHLQELGTAMHSTLYHGTDKEGAKGIILDGKIKGKVFLTPMKEVAIEYGGYDSNEAIIFKLDIDPDELMIDFDLPGQRLLSIEYANDYTGNDGWTIEDYLDDGYSVGINDDVEVSEKNIIKYSSNLEGVEGLYDTTNGNDIVYLVADMLDEDNLNSTLNHELYHRARNTDKKLQNSLSELDKRMQKRFNLAAKGIGTKAEKEAYNRVMDAKTKPENQLEEFQSYIVTIYNKKPESLSAAMQKWVRDLISTIRAALIRQGLIPSQIDAATLNALASYGARVSLPSSPDSFASSFNGNSLDGRNISSVKTTVKEFNGFIDRLINSIGIESSPGKSITESREGDAKFLSNILHGKAFQTHGFGGLNIPTKRLVMKRMLSMIHDRKIRDSIVSLVPVDMMDILTSKEFTPDMLLHDKSMLLDRFSVNLDRNIPLSVNDSITGLMQIVTSLVAENGTPAFKVGRVSSDGLATFSARLGDLRDSPAFLTAKIGFSDVPEFTGDIAAAGNASDIDSGVTKVSSASIATKKIPRLTFIEPRRGNIEINATIATRNGDRIKGRHDVTPNSNVSLGEGGADTPSSSTSIIPQSGNLLASKSKKAKNDGVKFSRANNDNNILKEAKRKIGLGAKRTLVQEISDIINRGLDTNVQILKDKWKEIKPKLEQGVFDKFLGIKLAEKEILGDVTHAQSGYIGARFSTGSSSTMQAVLIHGAPELRDGIIQKKEGTKSFAEILKPVKDDLENFTSWMVGRRAKRLYQEGKENNLNKTEIQALLDLEQDSYQGVADDIASMNKSILDLAEASGIVDPESRALFESNDYIPFYRLIDGKSKAPGSKKGLSHQSSGIKMLKGGDSPMSNPLGNMMQNWAHLIDASMKNSALDKTLTNIDGSRFVEKIPRVEFKQALIPKEQIKKLMLESGIPKEVVDLMPNDVTKGIAKMWAMQAPTDPDVVRVMRGGKSEYFKVHDAMLLSSLSAVNQEQFGGIFKPMRYMKRLLTSAITAEPTFMSRNFTRDSMHSWTIAEEKGFKAGIDSFHGAVKSLKEEGGYVDMMFAGASFQGGYGSYNDPEVARQSMDSALRKRGITDIRGFKESVLDTPKKWFDMYRAFGDAIENANREAILENAKRAGKSKAEYLFESKDIMDFSMQGSFAIIRAMGDMLPFFNARLVGLYRLAKAGKTAEARQRILVKGLSMATMSLALLAINSDNDDYEELEDWDKDQYWHFFLGDQHFRMPKPFELGLVFGTVPERSARLLIGKDTLKEFSERMGHGASDTLAFNPVPQMFKPFVEVYANENMFTGRPVEGMADEGKLPSARYNAFTSETMRMLSSLLPEELGASPKRLEHLMRGYLGSLGMYSLGVSDMMVRSLSDMPELPKARLDRMPVIKAFYQEKPAMHTKYGTQFYDMLSEVNQIHRTVNAYRKQGNTEKASELRRDNLDKLRVRKQLNKASKSLSGLRKQVDIVYRSDLSPAEKRSRIDSLMLKSNERARRIVQRTHKYFN